MPHTDPDVLVVGAGVIGLTTAICLAEAGVSTIVAAAEPPEHTTSSAAGAILGPHLVGMDDRVARWTKITHDRLTQLADDPATDLPDGIVRVANGIAASRGAGALVPEVASGSAGVTACPPGELPDGYKSAWRLSAPVVAMPAYLEYLRARYGRAGGIMSFQEKFASLSDAAGHRPGASVVINCAGYGARDLVPDPDVIPVRGQAVVVSNPGLTDFFVGTSTDPGDLTYLFPHRDTVVLGGTEEPGNASREPDPATAERIFAACAAIEPALRGARVLGHRVGLRPARPLVRLEAEKSGQVTILHNYGHGGAGVTLSWGCAQDAAALAIEALS